MLRYFETNWLSKEGLRTRSYNVNFSEVKTRLTVEEQEQRTERLSLVKIFDHKETAVFFEICTQLQKENQNFYFHKNRKFHATLLGFPVIEETYYDTIKQKVGEFCQKPRTKKMSVKFDLLRLGTKYENNGTMYPVFGVSNGTVIAYGDSACNKQFTTYGNELISFLIQDRNLDAVLGKSFRRRFPTVWCTMGNFTRDFAITEDLEIMFNKYRNLNKALFQIPCSELELGVSHYKDLRDWKLIQNFYVTKI
jgi:hypothetical protein